MIEFALWKKLSLVLIIRSRPKTSSKSRLSLEEDENYAGVYGRQEPMSFSSSNELTRDANQVFSLGIQ